MNKIIDRYLIKKILFLISQHHYNKHEKIMISRLLGKIKLKND